MKIRPATWLTISLVALLMWAIAGAGGSAIAGHLIGSKDIRDGSVRKVDLAPGVQHRLETISKPGPQGPKGDTGPIGPRGQVGNDGRDARAVERYWAVAFYDVGDTNAGAIATVACSAQTDVAISGGVQTLGLGDNTAPAAVASSFPGRMDWAANEPKKQRLDGWIVQFDADQPPNKVKVWALCERGANIDVVGTYTQSAG